MITTRLTKEEKQKLFKQFGEKKSSKDTGSSSSQIAIFTYRVKYLTEYLKTNKKDNSSMRGLIKMLGKRKRLLSYLEKKNFLQYKSTLSSLGLKK